MCETWSTRCDIFNVFTTNLVNLVVLDLFGEYSNNSFICEEQLVHHKYNKERTTVICRVAMFTELGKAHEKVKVNIVFKECKDH